MRTGAKPKSKAGLMIQSSTVYYPRPELSSDSHAEPGDLRNCPQGDFARGQRTEHDHACVHADFATGMRTVSTPTAIGDFATGMRSSSTPTAIGDFATGMRTVSAAVILSHDSASEQSSLPIAA